jgi:5-methylcytosine-specific restriction endonuclease McrA
VYNSTVDAYKNLIKDLPMIMENYGITEETIEDDKLETMTEECATEYFDENMIPAYNKKDIEFLLKFYAQKEVEPLFVTFDEIDRKKLDVADIAKKIYDEDMRRTEIKEYIEGLWYEEGSIIPIYYTNLYFFKNMINTELSKLEGDIPVVSTYPRSEAEKRKVSELPLQEIIKLYPRYGLKLREETYDKARKENGYECAICKKVFYNRKNLQINHIVPTAKGGLTVPENLQVLCRSCNMKKSDKLL